MVDDKGKNSFRKTMKRLGSRTKKGDNATSSPSAPSSSEKTQSPTPSSIENSPHRPVRTPSLESTDKQLSSPQPTMAASIPPQSAELTASSDEPYLVPPSYSPVSSLSESSPLATPGLLAQDTSSVSEVFPRDSHSSAPPRNEPAEAEPELDALGESLSEAPVVLTENLQITETTLRPSISPVSEETRISAALAALKSHQHRLQPTSSPHDYSNRLQPTISPPMAQYLPRPRSVIGPSPHGSQPDSPRHASKPGLPHDLPTLIKPKMVSRTHSLASLAREHKYSSHRVSYNDTWAFYNAGTSQPASPRPLSPQLSRHHSQTHLSRHSSHENAAMDYFVHSRSHSKNVVNYESTQLLYRTGSRIASDYHPLGGWLEPDTGTLVNDDASSNASNGSSDDEQVLYVGRHFRPNMAHPNYAMVEAEDTFEDPNGFDFPNSWLIRFTDWLLGIPPEAPNGLWHMIAKPNYKLSPTQKRYLRESTADHDPVWLLALARIFHDLN